MFESSHNPVINSYNLSVFQIKIIAPIVIFSPFWMSDLNGDLRLNSRLSRLSNIFPFETSHFPSEYQRNTSRKTKFFPSPKTRSRFLLAPISWIEHSTNLSFHLKLQRSPLESLSWSGYKIELDLNISLVQVCYIHWS